MDTSRETCGYRQDAQVVCRSSQKKFDERAKEQAQAARKGKLREFRRRSTDASSACHVAGQKQRDQEWKAQVEKMYQKVSQRPLLLEIEKREQDKLDARKRALQSIKANLAKRGITNFERFFDKEELEILELK